LVKPLQSRKVRVALATVVAAYAAEYGLNLSEPMVLTILGVGAALILGIAHEDNGAKSLPKVNAIPGELVELQSVSVEEAVRAALTAHGIPAREPQIVITAAGQRELDADA
jgi:hypothetical protein